MSVLINSRTNKQCFIPALQVLTVLEQYFMNESQPDICPECIKLCLFVNQFITLANFFFKSHNFHIQLCCLTDFCPTHKHWVIVFDNSHLTLFRRYVFLFFSNTLLSLLTVPRYTYDSPIGYCSLREDSFQTASNVAKRAVR